ncbi:DNA polymerase alpha subunit B N-terminal-domain-containing protein [Pseudomassariella vexata]|uniref:DNA polymerase alpha subunit B n=1 Tax=Pseudomassariella vexata TaxID=1141098 RepID=A0A1Y2EK60_9PEZI|nr:DNA polymerase alpha subunit B N-terminal-domain-containing protein [Pseudomassariella vexata]ORY71939.1 DNA polymerase alpha subunit B N-terminal-domain-containing protein [Pseudomassariella vexata]
MAEAAVQELNERFALGDKPLEPDMLAELQSIMRMHSLSAQDLFFKWESYCIKMDMEEMQLSVDTLRNLKRDIQDALERENRNHHAYIKTEKRSGATPRTTVKNSGDVFGMLDGLSTPAAGKLNRNAAAKKKFETPSVARVKGGIPSSPDYKSPTAVDRQIDSMNAMTITTFNDRQKPGEVIEVLNDHLKPTAPPIAPYGEPRIKLTAVSDQKKLGYKPLAMKSSEASEILDDRIDEFLTLVKEYHKLDDAVFGSAASQSTAEIYSVGRIASDSAEGKLNTASLVLETSRRTGGGLRIPLNVQKLKGFNFVPGQIVAFKGINTSGLEFIAHEFLDIPLLPNAASSTVAIEAHREKLRGGPEAMDSDDEPAPLNIIFGSGPYSADDNLDFEPLHALCSHAADTYADALVLCGPFIDVDHPLIASGDFDLPSDANIDPDTATMSTHVSWPQDPFPRKDLGLPKSARIIGNPMTLSLNEMLRHEELIGGRPTDAQLLSRLPRYLIEQRHYFPVYPPVDRTKLPKTGTASGLPTGAMLDTSYLRLGDMVNVRPDVLVVPSALPPFAKVVESVLVINPGYLSKRKGAGTYARMTLYPPNLSPEEQSSGGMVSHKIFDRARVEITRI